MARSTININFSSSELGFDVLAVEHNPEDFFRFKDALRLSPLRWSVTQAADGQEAVRYLNAIVKNNGMIPDFIISSLNTPGIDGLELLMWVRNHSRLKLIPFFLFSASSSESERRMANVLRVTGFYVKPFNLSLYPRTLKAMEAQARIWLPFNPSISAA